MIPTILDTGNIYLSLAHHTLQGSRLHAAQQWQSATNLNACPTPTNLNEENKGYTPVGPESPSPLIFRQREEHEGSTTCVTEPPVNFFRPCC